MEASKTYRDYMQQMPSQRSALHQYSKQYMSHLVAEIRGPDLTRWQPPHCYLFDKMMNARMSTGWSPQVAKALQARGNTWNLMLRVFVKLQDCIFICCFSFFSFLLLHLEMATSICTLNLHLLQHNDLLEEGYKEKFWQ